MFTSIEASIHISRYEYRCESIKAPSTPPTKMLTTIFYFAEASPYITSTNRNSLDIF